MKKYKIQDPIKARAIVAEMISKGGYIDNFPPRMTDRDWIMIANKILEVDEEHEYNHLLVPALTH